MIQKIKTLLSTALAARICLVVAILSKIGLLRIFLDVGTDKAALLITTKNFLAGHGISIGRTFVTDFADKTYVPYTGWPPGYALLLSPFLSLFPDNFMLAAFCVDILAAIIFFVFLQKILRQLGFSPWLSALFLLFQGGFLNEYIVTSHPTDFLALSFTVAGWYYCSRLITVENKWQASLLSAVMFIAAASVRYQYIPVCGVGLLWPLYHGFIKKNRLLFKYTLLSLVIFSLVMVGVLLFQKMSSGNYVSQFADVDKGWYPENLIRIYPFSVHSFIEIDFLALQLASFTGWEFMFWKDVFRLLSLPVMLIAGIFSFRWLKNRFSTVFLAVDSAWMIGGLLTMANIFLLLYLSLTISPSRSYINWTIVMDGRYFAFPILFLQLAVWLKLANTRYSNWVKKVVAGVIISLYSFTALHGLYLVIRKTPSSLVATDEILPAQPEMKTMIDFIKMQKKDNPTMIVAAGGTDNQLGYFADWYGANAFFMPMQLVTSPPKASQPVMVFLAISRKTADMFTAIIKRPGVQLYKEDDAYFYFTFMLYPG